MSGDERVCRYPCDCGKFPDEHCACMDGHASPPADTASTGADVEALAKVLWADSPSPGAAPTEAERDLARRFLASDWLASHDAATADRVRRETAEPLIVLDGLLQKWERNPAYRRGAAAIEVRTALGEHLARIAREQAR